MVHLKKTSLALFIVLILSNCGPKNEDFTEFFEKFKADTVFQKSRFEVPVTIEYFDEDFSNNAIFFKDTLNFAFAIPINNQLESGEKLAESIILNKDSTVVKFDGVDNGVSFCFVFKPKNLEWFLTRFSDRSN